jgi:hypothetical protein
LRAAREAAWTAEGIMQLRPLSDKAWASIFIAALFLAVFYCLNVGMSSGLADNSSSSTDMVQTQ